jgi:hypothetical protein
MKIEKPPKPRQQYPEAKLKGRKDTHPIPKPKPRS